MKRKWEDGATVPVHIRHLSHVERPRLMSAITAGVRSKAIGGMADVKERIAANGREWMSSAFEIVLVDVDVQRGRLFLPEQRND
jgi:hypothetical protein